MFACKPFTEDIEYRALQFVVFTEHVKAAAAKEEAPKIIQGNTACFLELWKFYREI